MGGRIGATIACRHQITAPHLATQKDVLKEKSSSIGNVNTCTMKGKVSFVYLIRFNHLILDVFNGTILSQMRK